MNVDALEPEVEEPGAVPPTLDFQAMEVEGYPEVGELRTGFIYDRAGSPMQIIYEIQDGLAIWQGDIVLGEAAGVARSAEELAPSSEGPLRGVVKTAAGSRWPNGVLPFTINSALSASAQAEIATAISWIQTGTTGVTIVSRTTETNYVRFTTSTGCSSFIGRIGGVQPINLAEGCSVGNTAHEILHALGMYHEHTRCDRDNFVTIDYTQVQQGRAGNFFKAGASTQAGACSGAFDIGTYAPGSIMHYGQFFFAIGTSPTITPKADVDGSVMGQRNALGPTDIATLNVIYNSPPVATIIGPTGDLLEGSTLSFSGSASTDTDDGSLLTFAWTFGDGTCPADATCAARAPNHTYADNDDFSYSLTVSDGFLSHVAAGVVTILNVAPSLDVRADATIDEGDEFAQSGSFTDPGADTWTATVDYGDGGGAQALALAGKTFDLAHTYVDNGVNTVTVEVTDDDGGVGDDDAEVTVNNVAPTVEAGPDATIDSGEIYDFSGTFSDPGIVDDPWEWVIEWGFGDDTDTEGNTSDQSAAIEASRLVCVAGDYTVTLSVTDKDGGTGSDDLTLTVPYITMDIDIKPGGDRNPVNAKARGRLPVAILGSPDLDVTDVDPSTLVLGDESGAEAEVIQKRNGSYEAHLEDVDGDGDMDLLLLFAVPDIVGNGDLTALTTELVLRGFLQNGCNNIRGVDSVTPLGN